MNKKLNSFIIILSTLISSSIMIASVNNYSYVKINTSPQDINATDKNNEKITLRDEKKASTLLTKNNITKSPQENQSISTSGTGSNTKSNTKSVQQNNMSKGDEPLGSNKAAASDAVSTENQITNQNETSVQNATGSEDENQQVALDVFKVKKDDILNKMSFFDKQKLFFIGQKLSTGDLNKVENYLMNDNGGNGVIDALKLLKEKLCDKDYSKVKNIVQKFINMDVVEESNLKN